jgi:hypothetical protein
MIPGIVAAQAAAEAIAPPLSVVEAAAAEDVADGFLGIFAVEAANAGDSQTTTLITSMDMFELLTAADTPDAVVSAQRPLDLYTVGLTACYSAGRQLRSSYAGAFYAATSGAITSLNDQSGGGRNLTDEGIAARRPAEATAGPNSRPAADFDGSSDYLRTTAALSSFIANSAGYIVLSGIVSAITQNSATITANDLLLGDQSQFAGFYLRNTPGGGTGTVYAYNWDGTADGATATFAVNTPVVLTWRHEGGSIYVSVNGAAEISVLSGNTSTMTGVLDLCGRGLQYSNSTIFELATWSIVPNATERAAIVADFKAWIGA